MGLVHDVAHHESYVVVRTHTQRLGVPGFESPLRNHGYSHVNEHCVFVRLFIKTVRFSSDSTKTVFLNEKGEIGQFVL